MNVRIGTQNLRFKITKEELEILLNNQSISTKTHLVGRVLFVKINPKKDAAYMEADLTSHEGNVSLHLNVSLEKIKQLSVMGRSREGIEQEIGNLFISLQVDIRNKI